ncbi:MAG: hypothetical protein GWN51_07685, partial [Gemmatimonadetes bacterium]|nr:hypothetical protein [Gemmatimonadota bacterium]NIW75339.1 hypothetical protein [Gemmatimonadota bacterium]
MKPLSGVERYHSTHLSSVDCSSCHMQGLVTCYNCHFESEVNEGVKRARGQITSWMFLVNREGKVHPANFQSVKYGNSTFTALAPFYAHTIDRNAVSACTDCHGNSNVSALTSGDSSLWIAQFDGASNVIPASGIIPVPTWYDTKFMMDFLDYDS